MNVRSLRSRNSICNSQGWTSVAVTLATDVRPHVPRRCGALGQTWQVNFIPIVETTMARDKRFEGETVLITGGARGQGAAEAVQIASEVGRVIIGDAANSSQRPSAKQRPSYISTSVAPTQLPGRTEDGTSRPGQQCGDLTKVADDRIQRRHVRKALPCQSAGLLPQHAGSRASHEGIRRGSDGKHLICYRDAWRPTLHGLYRDEMGPLGHDEMRDV